MPRAARTTRATWPAAAAAAAGALCLLGATATTLPAQAAGKPQGAHGQHHPAPAPDTGFAALQRRGESAMGVDQYSSEHQFEPLPDGGRIRLARAASDSAGVAAIRAHMREIAAAFARGDFSTPGFVHAQAVPGTETMARKREAIRYEARDVPGGAEVRITTRDSAALAAVHEFLAFQNSDHRTGH